MAAREPINYTTVTMDDGRIVEFPGARRILKTSLFPADALPQVRFDFVNGETRTLTITPEMLHKFAAHGAEQKVGDEAAGIKDLDDAILAVDELIDRLHAGEWGVKREASALAGASVLAKALVEFTGKSAEEIRGFLAGKSQAEKVALRSNPRIAPIVQRLEAAKTKKPKEGVDTDALLDGITG